MLCGAFVRADVVKEASLSDGSDGPVDLLFLLANRLRQVEIHQIEIVRVLVQCRGPQLVLDLFALVN